MGDPKEATLLLRRLRDGDETAAENLLPIVYAELHDIAERAMARQAPGHTLQATALLNEAWIRLIQVGDSDYDDRTHFLAVAAKAMRTVLIDHARRKKAEKRGGAARRRDLDLALEAFQESAGDLLELDEALARLATMDGTLARIVELRFFGGMSHPEISRVLGLSLRAVERGWRSARAWLHAELA